MISWSEVVPVVTVSDREILEPPARALREGEPCRIVVLDRARQFLKTPDGDELYGAKVRVTSDDSELQVMLYVPADAADLLAGEAELPAKRLEAQPNVVAVDWDAALAEAAHRAPEQRAQVTSDARQAQVVAGALKDRPSSPTW